MNLGFPNGGIGGESKVNSSREEGRRRRFRDKSEGEPKDGSSSKDLGKLLGIVGRDF